MRDRIYAALRDELPGIPVDVQLVFDSNHCHCKVRLVVQPAKLCQACCADLDNPVSPPVCPNCGTHNPPVVVDVAVGDDVEWTGAVRVALLQLNVWIKGVVVERIAMGQWRVARRWKRLCMNIVDGSPQIVKMRQAAKGEIAQSAMISNTELCTAVRTGLRPECGPTVMAMRIRTDVGRRVDEAIADPSLWPRVMAECLHLLATTPPEIVFPGLPHGA